MRPALPLLQLDSVSLMEPLPIDDGAPLSPSSPSSPNRPPTLPSSSHTTWRSVVVPGTAPPKMDADMVGVALLAAEARRRGGIMIRERGSLGAKGRAASPLARSRVRSLEKDVASVVRTMVRAKARARAQNMRARTTTPIAVAARR